MQWSDLLNAVASLFLNFNVQLSVGDVSFLSTQSRALTFTGLLDGLEITFTSEGAEVTYLRSKLGGL